MVVCIHLVFLVDEIVHHEKFALRLSCSLVDQLHWHKFTFSKQRLLTELMEKMIEKDKLRTGVGGPQVSL